MTITTSTTSTSADIEAWRDNMIAMLGTQDSDTDWAIIGNALHDVRVRDVAIWHMVRESMNASSDTQRIYRLRQWSTLAFQAAWAVPYKFRAPAFTLEAAAVALSVSIADDTVYCSARPFLVFALEADRSYPLARMFATAYVLGKSVHEGLLATAGSMSLDTARHGAR